MRPLWKLSDDCFGEKNIHVLVELPQEATTSPTESRVEVEKTKLSERPTVTESAGLATGETHLGEDHAAAAGANTGAAPGVPGIPAAVTFGKLLSFNVGFDKKPKSILVFVPAVKADWLFLSSG
jgi:hypothetical protein